MPNPEPISGSFPLRQISPLQGWIVFSSSFYLCSGCWYGLFSFSDLHLAADLDAVRLVLLRLAFLILFPHLSVKRK